MNDLAIKALKQALNDLGLWDHTTCDHKPCWVEMALRAIKKAQGGE